MLYSVSRAGHRAASPTKPSTLNPSQMLYLMSTTVIPHGADGAWRMESLSPQQAAQIAQEPFVSAVGHASSAEAMAAVLAVPVAPNRITVEPEPGDRFLCLRLLSRPPEGQILDRAAMEQIGFSWALLSYEG